MQSNSPQSDRDIVVRPVDRNDAAAWDSFVDRFPHHLPLARFLWRDVLVRHHGAQPHFLVAERRSGEMEGLAGAYVVRSLRGRKRLFTLQRGLLATSAGATQALAESLASLAAREGVVGGNITGETPQPLGTFAAAQVTTMVVPVSLDEQANWSGLRDKTRNMVRKAQRSGIQVRSGLEFLPALYDVYAHEMVSRGVPIYSRGLWRDVARLFGQNAHILVAEKDGQVIAGLFLLFGNTTACDLFQASRLETRNLAPVPMLLWEAMRLASAQGLSRFDLGPSTVGSNTYKAKVNFGGVPETFDKYDLAKPRQGAVPEAANTSAVIPAQTPSVLARADTYLSQKAWWPIRYRFNLWKRRQTSMF